MKYNDISIDSSVFMGLVNRIQSKIEVLERVSRAMASNLKIASQGFSSANFDRAKIIINDMQKKLSYTLERTNSLKKYLNSLQDCVQEYLSCTC